MTDGPRIPAFLVAGLLSAALHTGLAYFTVRSNFPLLIGEFALLFLLYGFMLWHTIGPVNTWKTQSLLPKSDSAVWMVIGLGIGLRVLLLFSIPNLSDDYFRFIWDGKLLAGGESPFLKTPEELLKSPERLSQLGLTPELFEGLNSKGYFTIYPPVNQLIFWFSALISPNSLLGAILFMKACLVTAEIGSLFLLLKLLKAFKLPNIWIAFYALNPLVITELSGNLHFEAVMIFFLLLSIWVLHRYTYWQATLPFALAISSKLLPIMLLPLLLRRIGWKKTIIFSCLSGLWVLLMFLPLLDLNTLGHMGESVGLYFQSFEFNASVYYLVRWIGYQQYGYNIIQHAGKSLAMVIFLGIWLYTFWEKKPSLNNLAKAMVWVLLIYFSGATIVHPWYITTLLALSTLSSLRFPLVWTLLLPLTYFTYRDSSYTENLVLVGIEYVILFLFVGRELYLNFKTSSEPERDL